MLDDSATYLIAALNNQIELLNNKVYSLKEDLAKEKEHSSFLSRKIHNVTKLLRDHQDGFSADAWLRRDRNQDVAQRDCEVAEKVCREAADKLESEEEYIYELTT
jgi:hypothetical protein